MTPERWQQIREVLEQALSLAPEQRSALLDRACAADSDLRREVETLLGSSNDVRSGFLQSPPLPSLETADRHELDLIVSQTAGASETANTMIGHYHLVHRIGEGGMGEVWLAEQTEPVRRRVALKLVKGGLNTRELIARFASERQALALMDHPAIAKVFDAGATPQGAPYFAMEYVAGIPITDYCDAHRLSMRERLELFTQVCDGVQHAHQRAIIHRDLKPSNILVAEVDGHAAPKIIDFGVAKALGEKLTDQATFTGTGVLVGTPDYMSPEQASSAGQDIDTRTDVYSLGVVFYELLAGARPISLHNVELEEFLRRLREEDPPKPSTKISAQDQATSTEVARKRQTEPQALVKQLRGELDSIAQKALEKERVRRYASPSEFAEDIKRYLNHEAVLAVPASVAYRTRKFVRRHRAALAAASAVALMLAAAAAVSIREGIRANREAAVAEAVNKFLQNDLLAQAGASAQSGPNAKPDPHLEVRTALDRAAERIEGKFTKQPEVEASIRDTMGRAYMDLGLYAEARKQLERALEVRRRVLGADDPKTLMTMALLGPIADLQGRYAEAEVLNRETLDAQRRVLGPDHPDTLASMNYLANVYTHEGKYAQAEGLHAQILEARKRVLGPDHPATLQSINNLALVYNREGKYAQAEELYTQALEIQKRVLGPEHPATLLSMGNLAWVYVNEGKLQQAEALQTQVLEIRKRVLGPEHTDTLWSMNLLAGAYMEEGKYTQAEALFTQALEIQKRVLGPENPYTASTLYNLGCLAARRGEKDHAIALLSQAVDHGNAPAEDLGMENDPDLASLHGDPHFAALVAHAKQVAEAGLKTSTTQASK